MARSLNLSLTDELRSFVDAHSGDGSTYATPSEFVRAVLREKKEREEAGALRDAVFAGYQDIAGNRVTEYTGDLKAMIQSRSGND